jgi:hypothetical protein
MFWIIAEFLLDLVILFWVVFELVLSIRNIKYQKKWCEEKAMRLRIDPAISRAELCEQYVMFCLRNNCKVEF